MENMTQLFPMLTKTQVCSSEIILPLKGPKLKFIHAKLITPTDLEISKDYYYCYYYYYK